MIIGVYGGTFTPFTLGHADIVKRALPFFDEVHIVLGLNVRKVGGSEIRNTSFNEIVQLYQDNSQILVKKWDGILARYALTLEGKGVLIRGIRSSKDLELEGPQADVNRLHFGVETFFLHTDPSLSYVSSSLVNELHYFGEDISRYIPHIQNDK